MTDRTFHGLYCDDIRHEVGGKLSLIGCYSGDMLVHTFPITLPKLCIHFALATPIEKPFEGPVTVTIYEGDREVGRSELSAGWMKTARETLSGQQPDRDTISLIGAFQFASLKLEKPTLIRTIAEIDGETLVGPKLWVSQAPAQKSD